jgi:ABC-type multidrug transport system ATPase subunit
VREVIVANGVGVRHRGQWIFQDLDLTVQSGQLVALTGPPGSGRTTALLALTGHFRHTHGTVSVSHAALGFVRGVHEPEPMLTAGEHLDERLRLLGRRSLPAPKSHRRCGLRGRAAHRRVIEEAVQRLPFDPGTLARDLSPFEKHLLMVEVAALSRPGLIAVDDIDLHLTEAEQCALIAAVHRDGRAALVSARSLPQGVSPSAQWELTK